MNAIWKYELKVTDVQTINIPASSNIISLQVQNGVPCIWVMVDLDDKNSLDVVFITKETRNEFNYNEEQFVGTYQLRDGDLVFHVFAKA